MKKIISLLTLGLCSAIIFSCDNVSNTDELQPIQDETTTLSNKNTNSDRTISKDLASKLVSALDANKDGLIDATEAPIRVEGAKDVLLNYVETNVGFNKLNPLPVKKVLDTFLYAKSSAIVISNGKIAEKNKSKLVSNLVALLLKDTSTGTGKTVTCYSSDMGYTTRKKFFTFSSLDSALLTTKILGQFALESGKDSSYGYLAIHRDYLMVDKYKSRLEFYDFSDFGDNLPPSSTHQFTDPQVN